MVGWKGRVWDATWRRWRIDGAATGAGFVVETAAERKLDKIQPS